MDGFRLCAENPNGPTHVANPFVNLGIGGIQYYGANALMNSRDDYHGRKLIDDTAALLLQDVYGYTITYPSEFGTFYDWLDAGGTLHISTPAGGNDFVTVGLSDSTHAYVALNIGNPVPGIDPTEINSTFLLSTIHNVEINTGDGTDTVTLSSGLGASIPVTVNEGGQLGDELVIDGSDGVDHVNMNFSSITSTNLDVSSFTGVATVFYGQGFNFHDSFVFDDRSDTVDHAWMLRSDRIGLNGETFNVITNPFGSVTCYGGSGVDNVYFIGDRNPNQSYDIETGDGNDVITVGFNTPEVQFHVPLTINAGAGSDVIVWKEVYNSYTADPGPVTYPISIDGGSGYNAMSIDETSQVVPGKSEVYDVYSNRIVMNDTQISKSADFNYNNMQAMQLQCGPSGTIVKVHSISSDIDPGNQFTILGTPAADTFIIYPHDASGNLTINGNLAIGGSSSTTDTLTIDDTGSSVPTTYTFANTFGAGTTNIYGMGMQALCGANIENITMEGGSGGNTYNVYSYESGTALHVFGGSGADTLNVGLSNLASDITNVSSFSFDGQGGADVVNFNNAASTTAFTYTQASGSISAVGGSYQLSLTDSSVEKLVVNAGSAGDTFLLNVVPSGTQTILNGNAGLDGLGLGFTSSNLDTIQGIITYNTGADAGNLGAIDTADTTADIVHLTTTSLGTAPGDTLFGLGGALFFDNIVNFGSFSGVTLSLGSGADTVFAEPLPAARETINGNNPTTAPGDALHVSLASAASPVFTSNGTGAGTYTFSNAGSLNYTGFESAAAAIPGDFDQNGSVTQADYTAWKAAYGNHVTPGTSGDATGDGVVDTADYIIWRNNLGKHSPGAGSNSSSPAVANERGIRQPTVLSLIATSAVVAERDSTSSTTQLPRDETAADLLDLPPENRSHSRDDYFDELLLQIGSDRHWFDQSHTSGKVLSARRPGMNASEAAFATIAELNEFGSPLSPVR